jgi:sirohydrochlorin cobaltochelatase
MTHGILLFAHGARDPAWARPFEQARDRLAARHASQATTQSNDTSPITTHVALAYLEFMSPTLPEAGRQLASLGCQRVTVVPLFLGAGGHVRKDLPVLVQQMQTEFPGVQWHLAPAVGETDIVVQALSDAAWHLAQLISSPSTP